MSVVRNDEHEPEGARDHERRAFEARIEHGASHDADPSRGALGARDDRAPGIARLIAEGGRARLQQRIDECFGVAGERRLATVVEDLNAGRLRARPRASRIVVEVRGDHDADADGSGSERVSDRIRRRVRGDVEGSVRREIGDEPAARRRPRPVVEPEREVLDVGGENESEEQERRDRHADEDRHRERIAERRLDLAPDEGPQSAAIHGAPRGSCDATLASTRRNTSVIAGCSIAMRAPGASFAACSSRPRNSGSSFGSRKRSPVAVGSGAGIAPSSRWSTRGRSLGRDVDVDSVALREAAAQLLRRGIGDQPAAIDEAHPVAVVGLLEKVGGDEHGDARLGLLLDDLPEAGAIVDVDARRRLVEKQQARPMQRGDGEAGSLADAGGKVLGSLLLERAEIEALAQRRPAPLELRARQAVQAGVELHVLAQRQALVEAHLLAHVADVVAYPSRPADDVHAVDLDRPRRRSEQADQHADRRALARAVGAEKGEDRSRLDGQVERVDGGEVAEPLGEAVGLDDRRVHRLSACRASASSVDSMSTGVRSAKRAPDERDQVAQDLGFAGSPFAAHLDARVAGARTRAR